MRKSDRGQNENFSDLHFDFARAGDARLIGAISRGSVPAFAELFVRTSQVVRDELVALPPGSGRRNAVFAATFLEVWWLAGCRPDPRLAVRDWILGIVRRRIADAGAGAASAPGRAAEPSYAELELVALLGGPFDRVAAPRDAYEN